MGEVNEGVAGDDVPGVHLIEGGSGCGQVAALGVHVDDAVGEEDVRPRAAFDDVGVDGASALEVLFLRAPEEETEESL